MNSLVAIAQFGLGILYPTFKSFEAIESPAWSRDDTQWLTYWVVFSFINFIEKLLWVVLMWIHPLYGVLKIGLLFWLVSPQFKGAAMLYRTHIRCALRAIAEDVTKEIPDIKEYLKPFLEIEEPSSVKRKRNKKKRETIIEDSSPPRVKSEEPLPFLESILPWNSLPAKPQSTGHRTKSNEMNSRQTISVKEPIVSKSHNTRPYLEDHPSSSQSQSSVHLSRSRDSVSHQVLGTSLDDPSMPSLSGEILSSESILLSDSSDSIDIGDEITSDSDDIDTWSDDTSSIS